MRGSYKSGQRRILSGSAYKIIIGVIVLVAAALAVTLLAVLPALDATITPERTIVSIEPVSGNNIGVGSNASQIPVRVTYSDGFVDEIVLGNTTFTGLDVTSTGSQKVVLSYGGFEQTVEFNVVDIACHISYRASVGGKIQGEMDQVVQSGEDAATVIAVPETGYVFVKWNDGYPLAQRKDLRVTKDGLLNLAIFEKASYYVRFYYDDGTVASEEKVTYGEVPTKIPSYGDDPKMEKYGYVFTGWTPNLYVDVDGENSLVTIDRNMNFTPEYVKRATDYQVTVPLDKYGQAMGKLIIRSVDYESVNVEGYFAHDQRATITATPYNSREFAYWLIEDLDGNLTRVDKDGSANVTVGVNGKQVAFSSTREGSSVQDYVLSFTPDENVAQVKIRAIFAYSNSDITFVNYENPENDNVELKVTGLPFNTSLNSYKVGDVDLTSGLPVPAEPVGMQFEGWYELGDESRTLITGAETFEQPTTLVAKWKRIQYTLIFSYVDDRDESVEWHTTVVTYQDAFASGTNGGLPLTNPTKSKYVFLGWQDALTLTSVDDRTKLYAEQAHIENEDFISRHRLYIIPIWAPKSHVLKLDFDGSGTAQLIIDKNKVDAEGKDLSRTVSVLGEYTITEDHSYELVVEAMEGNRLSSALWYYGTTGTPYDYGVGVGGTSYIVQETSDNTLYARFTPIRLTITVNNGSSEYVGVIGYDGGLYTDAETLLYVNYNDSASIRVDSRNPVFYIKDVRVDGASLGDVFGDTTKSYSFVLENVKSDVIVTVEYATAEYMLNVSVGEGGTVWETDLYDRATETPFAGEGTYAFGDEVYLRVKGDFDGSIRKVLASMRINGVLYDLFTNSHPDVTLYSYKINGVEYGVDLAFINGEYYFLYGEGTQDGTTYVFCQRIDGDEDVIFVKTQEFGDDVYTVFNTDAEAYEEVLDFLYETLGVAGKDVYDTSVVRDGRVTEVDFRVSVADHYNIIFGFRDISYSVTAESIGYGNVTVSETNPAYGGTSVLVAAPDAGYYVDGYRIGEGEYVPVSTAVKGENYRLTISDIDEDKDVVFTFLRIGYKVVFVNENLAGGNLFADGRKLNASVSFDYYYHDAASVKVTAGEGVRIASISVDGTIEDVHYNQSEYDFFLPDVKGDVTVRLRAEARLADVYEGGYSLAFATGDEIVGSARYIVADPTADNEVLLTARYGYTISTVLVRDKENGTEYALDSDPRGKEKYAFTIDGGSFTAGAQVEVVASATPKQYVLTTSAGENGAVSTGSRPSYGDLVSVDVTASDHCYIYAVYINGERISFEASNWSGLVADPNTGHYTYGLYSYVATGDMDLRAEFRVNTYKISVDGASVNGTTILSVGDSVTDYAPHGAYIYISMTADHGYHVSELYINGTRVTDLTFETDDENERTTAVYTYRGAYSAGVYSGVTGRTNVRVVYEINRYYFVYNLVNDSANFSSDAGMGTLTSGFVLTGNRYYGIEHGSNFSFDVTPTISNGYYLYSLTIDYTSSVGDNVVTRYYTDGYFDKNGGTIWFNRFVADDSGDSGVVANIAGITAVFRRNLYAFEAEQIGEADTGSVEVNFAHPNANVSGVYLFDGAQTPDKAYYYRNGVFYKRTTFADPNLVAVEGGYRYDLTDIVLGVELIRSLDVVVVSGVPYYKTDIAFVNNNGTYEYRQVLNDEVVTYNMVVEHGLRYTLTVAPTLGYERTSLLLNGSESNGFVSENRYSTNVVGAVKVVASFRILVYDVDFSVSVVDKNLTSTIDPELIANYMTVSIVVLEGAVYDAEYQQVILEESYPIINFYTSKISLFFDYGIKLAYGSKISFVMTPKFSTTGYYLYNFFLGSNEIPVLIGDRQVEASYAGPNGSGYVVVGDVTARCSFRIMRYAINTEIGYTEDIVGETVNGLTEESGSTIPWNERAYVKVTVGQGYSLNALYVRRAGDAVEHLVDLTETEDDDAFDEQIFYALRNDSTNEIRDVLVIKNVTGDVYVRAVFERETHVFRYKFNDASLLSVTTQYNPQNTTGFPRATDVDGDAKGYWADSNTLVLRTAYYDELLGILTPNNGYRITDTTAVIRAIKYDETTGEYVPVVDNAGDEIVTTIDLVNLGNDKKRFTFHNETSQLPALYVRYDLEVELNVVIKTYTLYSSINRVDAFGVTNDTAVNLDVKDKNANDVLVNGDAQYAQLLERDGPDVRMVVEHHGYILYTFIAPEGFMLSTISANGYEWNDLNTASVIDERMNMTVTLISGSGARNYSYVIRFNVQDPLIEGRNNVDLSRIVVSMRIAPIPYSVKIYIGNEYRDWTTLIDESGNTRSGATDGTTLSVYSPQSESHYGSISVEPALFEGYEVTGLVIRSGGDYDDVTGPDDVRLSGTNFSIPSNLSARGGYRFNHATLPGVNVLTNERTVYFFFTTHIISYAVDVRSYAYTLDESFRTLYPGFGEGTNGFVPLDSLAGNVEVSVVTEGVRQEFVSGNRYDYFSTVRVDFHAKEGYQLYAMEELREASYLGLVSGVNGVTVESSVNASGGTDYIFTYSINAIGDRSFRLVFKQETKVVVHLPNPFKFATSTKNGNEYRSYATLDAYENGVLLANESDDGKVADTYTYTVLVGNFVSFKYTDSNAMAGQTGAILCTYDPVREKYTEVPMYADDSYDSVDDRGRPIDKGKGKIIDSDTELYIVNNVYGRVTFTKSTFSAVSGANGGDILFNNGTVEPSGGYVYNSTTTVGKELKITVKPRENFVLSRLLVRQIDYDRSRALGYVVFMTGTYEWLEYDPDNFIYDDTNGFSVKRSFDGKGNTIFTIIMRGDMELEFEFYRYYKLQYGVQFANRNEYVVDNGEIDKSGEYSVEYCYPNVADQSTQTISLDSVDSNNYAPATSEDPVGDNFLYVQYDSAFTLTAPAAPAGYRFVGWYVNKYNTFADLDVALPDPSAVSEATFYVNEADTEGLLPKVSDLSNERTEAVDLIVRALYVPLIDVMVINELYYYNGSHWNSWSSGAVRTETYVYNESEGGVPMDTTVSTFPMTNDPTMLADLDYNTLLSYATDRSDVVTERRSATGYDTQYGWNLSYAELSRTSGAASASNMVYSAMKNFRMFYRYMNADVYDYDYWSDAILSLELTSTPSTVKLIGWQYYNWNTGTYEDVTYRYEDRSYGQDADGNYTTVDNSFTLYDFDLSYLYARLIDGTPAMPYAVSTTTENNYDNDRPLIIRPKFVKVTRLEVSEIAYTQQLGSGDYVDNFSNVIHPVISDNVQNTEFFLSIDGTGMNGEFDYGSTVHVDYYNATVEATGGKDAGKLVPLNYTYVDGAAIMELRYRFVGWRLNWNYDYSPTERRAAFRYIYYAGQDPTDPIGYNGIDLDLFNLYGDEPPAEAYELQAVFVVQYRHSIYSYNVAGSEESYNQAKDLGAYAYENAPDVSVALTSGGYNSEYFRRATESVECSNETVTIKNDLDVYESGSKFLQCLVDVGATYRLNVAVNTQYGNATDMTNSTSLGAHGYDPSYDHEYYRYEFKNTGKEKRIEPDGTFDGEQIRVEGTYNYDLQYISDAVLIFRNMMFESGVTLPSAFANYLTDNTVSKMTVWDVDETYGEGTAASLRPDGQVYIKTTLVNVPNLFGRFDYSLNGFRSGNGIKALKDITYAVNSAGATNGEYLFYANDPSFRRYVTIDYDGGGYISGGSQLFGLLNYTGEGGRFAPINTGNGTESSPYSITNVTQFRNLGLYFNYNEHTCEGVFFKLNADIKLQDVNSSASSLPYGNSKAWVPLTFAKENGEYLGFDGTLDGSNGSNRYTIYGLAADQTNLLSKNATTTNPLADFDYYGLSGYGIFGCINGGTIKNVNIGNAYLVLDSFGTVDTGSPQYVGVLTARAYNAHFDQIHFVEGEDTYRVGVTTNTDGNGNGSRVFVTANNALGVGLLAGYFYNSNADNCTIKISESNRKTDITIKGSTGSVGALIGVSDGNGTRDNWSSFITNCVMSSDDASAGLYVNYKTDSLTAAGMIGAANNGTKITALRASDNINMFLGNINRTTVNVGGLIGTMSKSYMENCFIESRNTDRYNITSGLNMMASSDSVKGDGVANATQYGKIGGLVAYAVDSYLYGNITGATITGVLNVSGPVAGGVVGVAKNSIIHGFSLYAPSYGSYQFYMMAWITMTPMAAYGTIVGAATSGTVIDECSVVGGSGNTNSGLGGMEDTVLYAYQKKNTADTNYQTILDNSSQYEQSRSYVAGETIQGNNTYAGGLVGYLSGALYNSYTQYARVTAKYKNGAPQSNNNEVAWAVSLGGLIGYLNVTQQGSTFFGWDTVATYAEAQMPWDKYKGQPMSRVQSCYAVGSSLSFAGYIWCDGFKTDSYSVELGRVGATLGGIVGSTSIGTKYGSYAINSCYTKGCNFIRNMGAYGLSSDENLTDDGKQGSADAGWVKFTEKDDIVGMVDLGEPKYLPNRAGVWVDGGIFGIVSGLTDDGTKYGNACNYCWCCDNTSTTNSWTSMDIGYNKRLSTTTTRGLGFTSSVGYDPATGKENYACFRAPYTSPSGDPIVDGLCVTSHEDLIGPTVFVCGYEIASSSMRVIYGGVLGYYGKEDGRVFKTNPDTGLPYIAHPYLATASDTLDGNLDAKQPYFWMYGGQNGQPVICLNQGEDAVGYVNFSASNLSSYLVRGQSASALN